MLLKLLTGRHSSFCNKKSAINSEKATHETQGKKHKRNLALLIGNPIPIPIQTRRAERRILNIPHRSDFNLPPFFRTRFHPSSFPIRFDPIIQYSQVDPLYDNDAASPKHVRNDLNYDPGYKNQGHDNEPIIEIIIKESNETIPTEKPLWMPMSTTPKNNINVFYVQYQKNPHGTGKDSVIYGKPVPALTPVEYHETSGKEEHMGHETQTETPDSAPKRPTTTLRAIIKPDSEQHVLKSNNLKITFGDSKYEPETSNEKWSDNDRSVVEESGQSVAYAPRPLPPYNSPPHVLPPQLPQRSQFQRPSITSFRDIFRKAQTQSFVQQTFPNQYQQQYFFSPQRQLQPQYRTLNSFLTPPPQQEYQQQNSNSHYLQPQTQHQPQIQNQQQLHPQQPPNSQYQPQHQIQHQSQQGTHQSHLHQVEPNQPHLQHQVEPHQPHLQHQVEPHQPHLQHQVEPQSHHQYPQHLFSQQKLPHQQFVNFFQSSNIVRTTLPPTTTSPTSKHPLTYLHPNNGHQHPLELSPNIGGHIYKSLPKYEQHVVYDQRDSSGKLVASNFPEFVPRPRLEDDVKVDYNGAQNYYNKYYSATNNPSTTTTTTTSTTITPRPSPTTTTTTTTTTTHQPQLPPLIDEKAIHENTQKLPDEVPEELRQQLLSSGVLGNADITVLDYDKIGSIPIDKLPPDQLATFLSAGGGQQLSSAGSEPIPNRILPDNKSMFGKRNKIEMKVVRFDPTKEDSASKYMQPDAKKMSPVRLNDLSYNRYLPLHINGSQFPIPNELKDRNISSVVILAPVDYQFRSVNKRDLTPGSKQAITIGGYLGDVIMDPSETNFQKWLEYEKMTGEKSIVFLIAKNGRSNENEVYKYDISTHEVNKADDDLSQQYIKAALANKIKRSTK